MDKKNLRNIAFIGKEFEWDLKLVENIKLMWEVAMPGVETNLIDLEGPAKEFVRAYKEEEEKVFSFDNNPTKKTQYLEDEGKKTAKLLEKVEAVQLEGYFKNRFKPGANNVVFPVKRAETINYLKEKGFFLVWVESREQVSRARCKKVLEDSYFFEAVVSEEEVTERIQEIFSCDLYYEEQGDFVDLRVVVNSPRSREKAQYKIMTSYFNLEK